MANRTVKDVHSIHGTNPQYLVKIIRTRICESKHWKEECFGLMAELVVGKAMELRFVGGVYGGNIKPTPFLCLTLKMLQIQPEKDIIVEFIKNEDFKYGRMLGALYMRLTGTAIDCCKYLEPLFNDHRKIKSQNRNGEFELMHVDEFFDELLHSERVCDILPWLQKRYVLEEAEQLEPRVSALEEDKTNALLWVHWKIRVFCVMVQDSDISSCYAEWHALFNLLFTSGIFHLIFWTVVDWVTETMVSKTAGKGGLWYVKYLPNLNRLEHWVT